MDRENDIVDVADEELIRVARCANQDAMAELKRRCLIYSKYIISEINAQYSSNLFSDGDYQDFFVNSFDKVFELFDCNESCRLRTFYMNYYKLEAKHKLVKEFNEIRNTSSISDVKAFYKNDGIDMDNYPDPDYISLDMIVRIGYSERMLEIEDKRFINVDTKELMLSRFYGGTIKDISQITNISESSLKRFFTRRDVKKKLDLARSCLK